MYWLVVTGVKWFILYNFILFHYFCVRSYIHLFKSIVGIYTMIDLFLGFMRKAFSMVKLLVLMDLKIGTLKVNNELR